MKEERTLGNYIKELLIALSFVIVFVLLIVQPLVLFYANNVRHAINFFTILGKEATIFEGAILVHSNVRIILYSTLGSLIVSFILFTVGAIRNVLKQEKYLRLFYGLSIFFFVYFLISVLFSNFYFTIFNKNEIFSDFEISSIFSALTIIFGIFIVLLMTSKILSGITYSIQEICETSILVGLAVVLDQFLKIPVQANGGSISFAPIPLFIIAIRYGGFKGFIASGLIFGLITCLLDGYGFQTFPFDYLVALSGYGLIGTFVNFFNKFNKNNKNSVKYGLTIAGVIVGGVLATVVRYFGHMVSGFILYQPITFVENFIYQSSYVPLTMLVSVVGMCILIGPVILINRVFKVKTNGK